MKTKLINTLWAIFFGLAISIAYIQESHAQTTDKYVVLEGDTIFEVQRKTGTYWKDVIKLNNIQSPYNLTVGDSIVINAIESKAQTYVDGWIDGYLARGNDSLKGDLTERRLWWAVAKTESSGNSSLPDNKIAIRYEPHWMKRCYKMNDWKIPVLPSKLTKHIPRNKWKTHRYANSYKYLHLAKKYGHRASESAHCATSYGKYQIMGFHYKKLGFNSAKEMADEFHLNANDNYNFMMFIKFLKAYRKGKAYNQLMAKNFNGFALTYNGSIRYAKKLRANYKLAVKTIK